VKFWENAPAQLSKTINAFRRIKKLILDKIFMNYV
jgi:hypothetical protein